jgi:hypothetical protein
MPRLSVSLDLSFVEPALEYMTSPGEADLDALVAHEAAVGVYAHALRYGNTSEGIKRFWGGLLRRASGDPSYEARARAGVRYLKHVDLSEAYAEVGRHLPESLKLRCRLFGEVGYDIGVVSGGDAYLNLGHPHFASEPRELVYFAVHELHHVGYTRYNPPFTLSDVKSMRDLEQVVKYSTHLEGTAVYAAYEMRGREGRYGHIDYTLYNDADRRETILREFSGVLESIEAEPDRELTLDEVSEVLGRLSGERLWYVSGLHMAKTIDENLGRDALTGTIVDGSESFFRVYEECLR